MRLNLVIQVYRGGVYWQEAWQSVLACLDDFQSVCISFNFSELQEQDIALVQDCDSPKVCWIRQTKFLTACEHSVKVYHWLSGLNLQGHFVFFCHDDILSAEGIRELRSLPDSEGDAVFGSFWFFDSDGKHRAIGVRQFALESQTPLSVTSFARYLFDHRCMISLSGIVLSRSAYFAITPVLFSLKHGCGSEIILLVNPHVRRIYQTRHPMVKIRLHGESEGHIAEKFPFRKAYDFLFFCLRCFVLIDDPQTRISITRAFGVAIREQPGYTLLALLPASWTLLKLTWRPVQMMKIYFYLARISAIRGYDFILRKSGLDIR